MAQPPTPLAEAIYDLRGLRSQEQFATELGVTRQTVAAWEAGTVPLLAQARTLVAAGIDRELFMEARRAS